MSPESTQLPGKWFVAAALFALLIAASAAALLLRPTSENRGVVQDDQAGKATTPQEPQPGDGSGKQPASGPATPPPPALRQSTADKRPIAWGEALAGNAVRIEVAGVDESRYESVEFLVAQGNAPARAVKRTGFAAELTGLAPGRYRWSARLRPAGNAPAEALEPPRGDPRAADFIILPPSLALSGLQQTHLDGTPIGEDLRAEAGVLLSAATDSAGAVLEVEIKPAAKAFDGTGLRRAPVLDGNAQAKFFGADGPYRWRARLTSPEHTTDWKEFQPSPRPADFILYHKSQAPTPPSAGGDSDGQSRDPSGEPKSDPGGSPGKSGGTSAPGGGAGPPRMYSSGLGGGSRDPLPSQFKKLPSLWDRALFRTLASLGVALALLGALFFALRLWRKQAKPRA